MSGAAHAPEFVERRLPPVTELGMATIALVAVGVIYLAAYLPRHAPLGPAIGLLVLAAGVLVTFMLDVPILMGFTVARFEERIRPADPE